MKTEIKNNKVPQLRFPEFKGVDNRGLKKYHFDDIFLFSTGKNIKQSEASKEFETPCVRYGELYHMYNEVIYEVINRTNIDKTELFFSDGDEILLPSAGEDPLDIGSASALTLKNIAIGRTINILKPKIDSLYSQIFVSYYINQQLRRKISSFAKGVSISNVYNSDLRKLEITLPSYQEQTKIAHFLTAVDKRINLLQKKKAELEQYKKGLMQQLFSKTIRFRDENGNDFPDWEEKKLSEISDITTGSSNRQDSSLDGTYTFFDRSEDIRTSSIFLFDCEAIIVGGEGSDFVPKYFVGKFDLHQRTYAIMNFRNANGKYLFYYIHYFRRYFLSQAVGSTVKSLRLPMFQKMPINTPILTEQQKIANFLSSVDKKIEKTGQQIDISKNWKQGLLQKMFV